MTDDDPLLNSARAAALAGLSPATWRSYRRKGLVPPPDDPDEDTVENRRNPRWRRSTVEHFMNNRIGRGYRRPPKE